MNAADYVVITCIVGYPVAAVVSAFLYHAWKTTRGEADKQDLVNYTGIALLWGWAIVFIGLASLLIDASEGAYKKAIDRPLFALSGAVQWLILRVAPPKAKDKSGTSEPPAAVG